MSRSRRIHTLAYEHGETLRAAGFSLFIVGGVFFANGLGSYFNAFSGNSNPEGFWWAPIGLALIAVGVGLLKFAYIGTITRHVAGETLPVAADSLNYAVDETKGNTCKVARAMSDGESNPATATADSDLACGSCQHPNEPGARCCSQCGTGLAQPKACPACHTPSDAHARFCNSCGSSLSQQ